MKSTMEYQNGNVKIIISVARLFKNYEYVLYFKAKDFVDYSDVYEEMSALFYDAMKKDLRSPPSMARISLEIIDHGLDIINRYYEDLLKEVKANIVNMQKTLSKNPPAAASLATSLPGMDALVLHPDKDVAYEDHLYSIIIDLNDTCKWTREQIADWLETLDIDMEFKNEYKS